MALEHASEHIQALLYSAYSTNSVRAMEQPLLERDVPLMRMAASATANVVLHTLQENGWDNERSTRIVVLAGAGDNGGDGLYAGAFLAARGYDVTAIAVGKRLHNGALDALCEAGGKVLVLDPYAQIPGYSSGFSAGEAGERLQSAIEYVRHATVVLDAMTGIGVTGSLHGIAQAMATALGRSGMPDSGLAIPDDQIVPHTPITIAVDMPSGIGVNDGTLPGPYIPADITIMFGAMKPCAMLPPACYACGKICIVDFDFDLMEMEPAVEMVTVGFASEAIRPCRVEDAKYSRGVLGLVTGSQEYPGAAVLSTCAAARSNIGMVRYVGPQRAQDLILHKLPEAVMGKGHVQAWAVGSGVPVEQDDADMNELHEDIQQRTITALLQHYARTGNEDQDARAEAMPPIVVDAGALDLLPNHVTAQVVLTPHAGELARLLTRLGHAMSPEEVLARPWHCIRLAAQETGATVLLKGAVTLVAGNDGGTLRVLAAGRAPASLATAGAGDVLTGLLGALLAQQSEQVHADAACMPEIAASAAYMHGRAAALASGSDQRGWHRPMLYHAHDEYPVVETVGRPIVAGDVVEAIPAVFEALQ